MSEDLSTLTRPQLDARAAELGVENPKKLPNKGAVIEAIHTAEATQPQQDPAIDPVTGEPWRAVVNGVDITGEEAKEVVLRNRALDESEPAPEALEGPVTEATEAAPTSSLGLIPRAPESAPGYRPGLPSSLRERIEAAGGVVPGEEG